jgi:hypothetical protein
VPVSTRLLLISREVKNGSQVRTAWCRGPRVDSQDKHGRHFVYSVFTNTVMWVELTMCRRSFHPSTQRSRAGDPGFDGTPTSGAVASLTPFVKTL